jgi:hypothetical protein
MKNRPPAKLPRLLRKFKDLALCPEPHTRFCLASLESSKLREVQLELNLLPRRGRRNRLPVDAEFC